MASRSMAAWGSWLLMVASAFAVPQTLQGTAPESTPGAPGDLAVLLERYQDQLTQVRLGAIDAEAPLAETSAALGLLGRADAEQVARFYLEMPREQRRAGLEAEERFLSIRARIQDASRMAPERWMLDRERIRGELLALIESQTSALDPTPAARAHALLARLDVARLDRDGSLDEDRREELLERAEHHAQAARNLFGQAHQRTPQLEPLWLQAELQRLGGDTTLAGQNYRELADLASATGRDEYRVQALRGLVCLAREAGDVLALEQRLQEWSQLEDPRESWPLAMEQSLWLLAQDLPRNALTTLWACQPKAEADRPAWQALLASALRRRGHLPAARRALERMQSEHPEEIELLTLAAAEQERVEGNPLQARVVLEGAYPFDRWSPRGRVQALALFGEVLLAVKEPRHASRVLDEALESARTWESRRLGPGSVAGEWLGLHAVVLAAQARAESGDLLGAAAVLEQNQARNLRRAVGGFAPTEALRTGLEAARERGAGLLAYGFGSDFGLVVYLGPDGREAFARIEHGRGAWQLALRRWSQAVRTAHDAQALALGAELSASLFPSEVQAALAGQEGRPLLLLAHGLLQSMPLALLSWQETPLPEAFDLHASPSLPNASGAEPTWNQIPWRFLGSPAQTQEPDLPAASAELQTLAAAHRAAVLVLGAALNPQAMQEALATSDALHIATHLVASTQCDGQGYAGHGLLLSAGEVTCAAEIANRSGAHPLVYLGTCSSGTGTLLDGEGTLGIARAFLESGTRNLVISLWPVEDLAAARFASGLHQALDQGLAPGQAVQAARSLLRAEGFPLADWAAFQHLGLD